MLILSNVLIEAEGETLSVTTTNLDLGICADHGKRGRRGLSRYRLSG